MKGKSILGSVALALAGIIGIAYVGFSVARNSWNPAKWVTTETEVNQPQPPITETTGGAVISETNSNGISLTSTRIAPEDYETYGIAPQSDSAQILTAEFTPAATTNKAVTWTVTGGNGKVTVTPVSGSPLQATVSVSGAFYTQAIITCTSQENSNIKATCNVDYLMLPVFDNSQMSDYTSIKDDMTISWNEKFDSSSGTIKATSSKGDIFVNMSRNLYSYLSARHSNLPAGVSLGETNFMNDTTEIFSFEQSFLSGFTEAEKSAVYEDIAIYYQGQEDVEVFYWSYDNVYMYYNGEQYYYSDGENLVEKIYINSFNDLYVNPQSLNLDKNQLIFGWGQ